MSSTIDHAPSMCSNTTTSGPRRPVPVAVPWPVLPQIVVHLTIAAPAATPGTAMVDLGAASLRRSPRRGLQRDALAARVPTPTETGHSQYTHQNQAQPRAPRH